MSRFTSLKSIAIGAIVLGAFGAASAAHARSDVVLSIGVNAPFGYVQPAPVYVQPRPVYVQPQPVYVQPGYGVVNHQRRWRDNEWRDDRRQGHQAPGHNGYRAYGDRDRDGVPNRYDRQPNNPYRY